MPDSATSAWNSFFNLYADAAASTEPTREAFLADYQVGITAAVHTVNFAELNGLALRQNLQGKSD